MVCEEGEVEVAFCVARVVGGWGIWIWDGVGDEYEWGEWVGDIFGGKEWSEELPTDV